MTIEELRNKLSALKEAEAKALKVVLENASDEAVEKLNNTEKLVRECEAEIEKMENRKTPVSREPQQRELSESEKFCRKLVEAVSTSGNFSGGLPREMSNEVIKKMDQYAALRKYCRIYTVSSDFAITVESGLPTVAYVAEGGTIGDTAPATAPVILSAKKLACISKISNEAIRDVEFDVVGYVEDTLARAFANHEDHEILQGAGSTTAMEGIIGKTGIGSVTTAAAATITWAEVKKLIGKLKGYTNGCILVMSQEAADMIHDLKDGSGNYLFPQNEELTRIKGHPVVISEQMPAFETKKVLIVAGNFDYYALGDRTGFEITLLNELYAGTDQVGIRAIHRKDGKVLQAGAFATLVSA